MRVVMIGDVKLTLFLGGEGDEQTVEDLDVMVTYPDGARYSASILTLSALKRIMDRHEVSGENFGGRYFQSRDLVVVKQGGVGEIVDLVDRLLREDELRFTFDSLGPEED